MIEGWPGKVNLVNTEGFKGGKWRCKGLEGDGVDWSTSVKFNKCVTCLLFTVFGHISIFFVMVALL